MNPEKKAHYNGWPYRRQREKAGFTQEQAIAHLPFSLRSLQAYENGETQPKFKAVCALAQAYHCKLEDFDPNISEEEENNQ